MSDEPTGCEIMRCYGWRISDAWGALFYDAWISLADHGACDGWGGSECVRVWLAYAKMWPKPHATAFIQKAASERPPNLAPGLDGEGKAR